MCLPGERVEELIGEEVGDGKSAVLKGTEGLPQGSLGWPERGTAVSCKKQSGGWSYE